MTEIDSLQISIETSSGNAARGIDDLAASLGKLKDNGKITTAVKNLNLLRDALKSFGNASSSAGKILSLAASLEKLKSVGSVANIGNSLTKMASSLKSLNNISVDKGKIDGIASALGSLSAVKPGGINTMMNGLLKIGKATEALNDAAINAFVERITILTEKLTPLATKMTTIQVELKGIGSSARSAASGVKEMGDELDASSVNLSSFIYIVQEAVQWLQAAIQKFSQFMGEAIEWDGIAARFGRGFGDQAQETYEWIQRLNEEMGINIQQFMKYSSVYATMLTGFGVANEDATKMALGYTELTYDIWAGYNDIYKNFDDAAEAVKSAIAGEVEPIRRAGFTIVESTLEQTAANHGLEISLYSATEAQKSYLRYLTLVDQAQAQGLVGTYAKELNTAEGLTRTLAQQMKSLTQAFGSLFLPILVRVVPWIQAFVELLTDAIKALAAFLGVTIQDVDWSGYGEGIGGVAENTGNLGENATEATKALKDLKKATLGIDELNVISPPSASGGASGGAGGGAGGGGFDGLDINSLWDETIFDNIQSDVDEIKEKLKGWMPIIASIAAAFAGLRLLKLITDIKNATDEFKKLFRTLAGGGAAAGGAGGLFASVKEFFAAVKQNAPEVGWFAALFPKLSGALAGLPAVFAKAAGALSVAAPWIAVAAAIVGGIVLALVDYDFTDVGYTIGNKIGEALSNFATWVGEVASAIGKGIKTAFEWAMDILDIEDVWDVLAVLFVPGEWFRRIIPELNELFVSITEWINEKIENFKGNINEFFGGFFDGLFDGLGWDMSWAEKFAEFFDIKYLDIVEAVMNPRSIGSHIVTGIKNGIEANGGMSAIKDKLSSMWDSAKTWWDNSKPALKTYIPSIGSVKDKVSSAWTSAKNWWDTKKSALKSYTPSIGSIYEKIKPRWDSARTWWNDKKTKMKEYTPSIGSIYEKAKVRWDNAKDWWNKKKGSFNTYTPSIGSIYDKVKSAWNSAKSWWNKNAKLSTKLDISVPKIEVKWDTASAFGKSFRYPTGFKLKFAADGGIFDKGSLVWAGERGPEVVANAAGGKTGVMNVQQMQEAVYEGVYNAVVAAMSSFGGNNGSRPVNVYLDGKQITTAVERRQRERGAAIMGNQVYSY